MKLSKIIVFCLLIFYGKSGLSQNVCKSLPSNAVAGAFDIVGGITAGCTPFKVKLADKSGGTDIRYDFYYKGQPPATLPKNGDIRVENPYFTTTEENSYTILQYGKKGGKDMYACKTITVRPNSQPKFGYKPCNNSDLTISIPKDSANNFQSYKIDWGDGVIQTIAKTQLPYLETKKVSFPRSIYVDGVNPNETCPVPKSILIPFQNSSLPGFSGYSFPNHANIKELELITGNKAVLSFTGFDDADGNDIYMTEKGVNYPEVPILKAAKVGDVFINIPDSTKSYCFQINRKISCGDEFSNELCTVVIDNSFIDETTAKLSWSPYPTSFSDPNVDINPQFGRSLYSKTQILRSENNSPYAVLAAAPTNFFVDTEIDCFKRVCYQVETETNGQLFYYKYAGKSISKPLCVDRKQNKPPALQIPYVTVDNNSINIEANYQNNPNVLKVILFRDNKGNYSKIDSISSPKSSFLDLVAKPQEGPVCYKVSYKDKCGTESLLSNAFCSMYLKETVNQNIQWSRASPFLASPIKMYEVVSIDPVTKSETVVKSLDKNVFDTRPDYTGKDSEAIFKIKATNEKGEVSYSNTLEVILNAKITVPEAFSPNNDGLNDVLQIFGRFQNVKEFNMKIYDRWGN
ncbi:MAG: gliding motility-associated C-terminal domain-containing protein, partial [Leadbetterella sp.]